jgi:putative SOS response-associated peptidase YedK
LGTVNETTAATAFKQPAGGKKHRRAASTANALTRPIHDRMPVVLDKADFGLWLSGAAGAELLGPADRVRMWPVPRRVNKTGSGDDDPTLIDEVAA